MRNILLFAILSASASAQTIGSGVTIGQGVFVGGFGTPAPPTSGIFFAPVAGHYLSTQNVAITSVPASGVDLFYTADGSAATEASLLYSPTVTVASNTTLNALAITAPNTVAQQLQRCSTGTCWKTQLACSKAQCAPYVGNFNTPAVAYGTGSGCNSGVCGIPTAINYLTGIVSPSLSGNATHVNFTTQDIAGAGGETQVLWANKQAGCDACTYQVEDFYERPGEGFTDMQAIESDLVLWVRSRNLILSGALQCDIKGLTPSQWEYNGQAGGWNKFGFNDSGAAMTVYKNGVSVGSGQPITEGCGVTNMTGVWTHVQYHVTFNPNVHDCTDVTTHNPTECIYIDYLATNGDVYTFGTGTALDQNGNTITVSLLHVPAAALPAGFPSRCFDQFQPDGRGTGASPSNPVTYGFYYDNVGMSCGGGTPNATGTAVYTIP